MLSLSLSLTKRSLCHCLYRGKEGGSGAPDHTPAQASSVQLLAACYWLHRLKPPNNCHRDLSNVYGMHFEGRADQVLDVRPAGAGEEDGPVCPGQDVMKQCFLEGCGNVLAVSHGHLAIPILCTRRDNNQQ